MSDTYYLLTTATCKWFGRNHGRHARVPARQWQSAVVFEVNLTYVCALRSAQCSRWCACYSPAKWAAMSELSEAFLTENNVLTDCLSELDWRTRVQRHYVTSGRNINFYLDSTSLCVEREYGWGGLLSYWFLIIVKRLLYQILIFFWVKWLNTYLTQ